MTISEAAAKRTRVNQEIALGVVPLFASLRSAEADHYRAYGSLSCLLLIKDGLTPEALAGLLHNDKVNDDLIMGALSATWAIQADSVRTAVAWVCTRFVSLPDYEKVFDEAIRDKKSTFQDRYGYEPCAPNARGTVTSFLQVCASVNAYFTSIESNKLIRGYVAGITLTLAKGGTMTNMWYNKRTKLIVEDGGFQGVTIPDMQYLTQYHSKFVSKVSHALMIPYTLFRLYATIPTDAHPVFKWVIEQSKGMNCASLSALADVLVSYKMTWTLALTMFPATEIKEALQGMIDGIANPFGSHLAPFVTMAKYRNLAYLSVKCQYDQYAGTDSMRKSAPMADAIDAYHRSLQVTGNAFATQASIAKLKEAYADANIMDLQGALHAYPQFAKATVVEERQVVIRDLSKAMYQDVAADVRLASIQSFLTHSRNDNDNCAVKIATAYKRAIDQSTLETNSFKEFLGLSTLEDDLKLCVATLNLALPKEINPEAYNTGVLQHIPAELPPPTFPAVASTSDSGATPPPTQE